mgnify:CR=1 FL=1
MARGDFTSTGRVANVKITIDESGVVECHLITADGRSPLREDQRSANLADVTGLTATQRTRLAADLRAVANHFLALVGAATS